MKIRIVAMPSLEAFALQLLRSLQRQGHEVRLSREERLDRHALAIPPLLDEASLRALRDALYPLMPPLCAQEEAGDSEAVLYLGDADWPASPVQILGEDRAQSDALVHTLRQAGVDSAVMPPALLEGRALYLPDDHAALHEQVLLWLIRAATGERLRCVRDMRVPHPVVALDRSEALDEAGLRRRLPVKLHADDGELALRLKQRLQGLGLERIELSEFEEETMPPFTLELRDMRAFDAHPLLLEMQQAVREELAQQAIDATAYPLVTRFKEEGIPMPSVRLLLPATACREGRLPAYAGTSHRQFELVIHSDAPEDVAALQADLESLEPFSVRVQALPESACRFALVAPESFRRHHPLAQRLREAMRRLIDEHTAVRDHWTIHEQEEDRRMPWLALTDPGEVIVPETIKPIPVHLVLPLAAARSGELERRQLQVPESTLTWFGPESQRERWAPTMKALGELLACKKSRYRSEVRMESVIQYGGAPTVVIDRICAHFEELGVTLDQEKAWDEDDSDIYIHLPAELPAALRDDATSQAGELAELEMLRGFSPGAAVRPSARPFIHREPGRLWVGEQGFEPRGGDHRLAPPLESFRDFVVDQATAELLDTLARAVTNADPALLIGETGTSKTSSVLYLAALLNQPVARINLNGQTDAAELIGRYLPAAGRSLPEMPALIALRPRLQARSRALLDTAVAAGRELTAEERDLIAAIEQWPDSEWRWVDGLIPQAMREGWWVILDEVNLAEPQVIERLNPVLEQPPSLVLTEHDGRVIGGRGAPVSPHFRIFATMNPADYAGRSALSPAFCDRWLTRVRVPPLDEAHYAAMLGEWLLGRGAAVHLQGLRYPAVERAPRFPRLAEALEEPERFVQALAAFQHGLSALTGQTGDATVAASRRGLKALLRAVEAQLPRLDLQEALRQALWHYCLRPFEPSVHSAVYGLMVANGLDRWFVDAKETCDACA